MPYVSRIRQLEKLALSSVTSTNTHPPKNTNELLLTSVGYMHRISSNPAPPPATRFFQKGGGGAACWLMRRWVGRPSRGMLSCLGGCSCGAVSSSLFSQRWIPALGRTKRAKKRGQGRAGTSWHLSLLRAAEVLAGCRRAGRVPRVFWSHKKQSSAAAYHVSKHVCCSRTNDCGRRARHQTLIEEGTTTRKLTGEVGKEPRSVGWPALSVLLPAGWVEGVWWVVG